MKKLICFILLACSCCLVNANPLPNNNVVDSVKQVQRNVDEVTVNTGKPDVVSSLTLAVNAINNIQTWSAVMIAVLTLFLALVGFFGYRHIKKDIKENFKKNNKSVNDKIQEIDGKQQAFDNCLIQIQAISERLDGQQKYMCKTNQYLYEALDNIANQISNATTGKVILKEMYHNYHITNLYSAGNKFAALAYLRENGILTDIEHLEFVSKYDSNDDNKILAREIIGIIKHKNNV